MDRVLTKPEENQLLSEVIIILDKSTYTFK